MMLIPKSLSILPSAGSGLPHNIYLVFSGMIGLMGIVLCMVLVMMGLVVSNPSFQPHRLECGELEKMWTWFPILVVLMFGVSCIYSLGEMKGSPNTLFSVFVIGHQWYWEYEMVLPVSVKEVGMVVGGMGSLGVTYQVESYGIRSMASLGDSMLSSSDAHLILPVGVPVRVVVTSGDVIHNFNLKIYAISVDAVPGRLNNVSVILSLTGVFLGWCSENCGVGHYSMPCSLESISFSDWMSYFLDGPPHKSGK